MKSFGPDSTGTQLGPDARFANERDGLELLARVEAAPPLAPRPYAVADAERTIVIEDLGDPGTLVEPLLGDDAANASEVLRQWARRLGEQHSRTAAAARPSNGARDPVAVTLSAMRDRLGEVAAILGLGPSDAAARDLDSVIGALDSPAAFSSFLHGDPCPDNCYRSDGSIRFIDFEFGRFGHALLDGVYWHVQFPTCSVANRLPDALIAQLEETYRSELVNGCAAAGDDAAFGYAVALACAARTMPLLRPDLLRMRMESDDEWGLATVRQRYVPRLRAFASVAEKHAALPALAELAARAADVLNARWQTEDLPLFPAFRQRA